MEALAFLFICGLLSLSALYILWGIVSGAVEECARLRRWLVVRWHMRRARRLVKSWAAAQKEGGNG